MKTKDKKQENSTQNRIKENIIPLFNTIDIARKGHISSKQFWDALAQQGILESDFRLRHVRKELETTVEGAKQISLEKFASIVNHVSIVKKALTGNLVLKDFSSFTDEMKAIFEETILNTSGAVADYIPQLARVDPEKFGIAITTVDGQHFSYGDSEDLFCLQSTCKPINYCMVHDALGEKKVHQHVGREPSGRSFNEMALNREGLPHNPLINSGAIMSCALLKPELEMSDRFDHVLQTWENLSGGIKPSFNNSVYLSERKTADRNFALAYFMSESNAFPEETNLVDTLEFYFQCCAIEATANSLAQVASTLANGGMQPQTGQQVFNPNTVKNCLSLMNSCGMYDFSGEFAFTIGFPAKSGVSGALLIVIPNVMGITIWSPKLDQYGNSVRGVAFCKKITERFNFHNYDNLVNKGSKKDPRKKKFETKIDNVLALIWAAAQGDLDEIKRLEALGVDLNAADYDGRTAMHLAASEGQLDVVKYLIFRQAKEKPKDRWGSIPLADAKRGKHQAIVSLLAVT
jgi:glutaminase